MQNAIQKELGLSPVEENVIVLYDGEKDQKTDEFWKVLKLLYIYIIIILWSINFKFTYSIQNQRIVEMPKKRPAWFHRNLLEPTTQEPSDKTDVKPTSLA